MTRIIGGTAGGRRLRTPRGDRTRPTSDRVREAFFSAVESRMGVWSGLRVLDLYAGSGAIGLEALSRGAAAATAVEHDVRTAQLIRRNAESLGLRLEVVTRSVRTHLTDHEPSPYDVVFSDPPYSLATEDVVADLLVLARRGWLAEDSLVVVERSSRSAPVAWPEGYEPGKVKAYGETSLAYARW
jgi:16S rRNA (guanine966-N2)-methyltransferase